MLSLENLKNLYFNRLPLTKVYIFWAKIVQRSYVWWYLILMQNLKENWLVVWRITWRIWKIFNRALKSLNIGTMMGFFKIYDLKIYMGVMRHDNEEWCQSWRGIDLSVQNGHKEFDESCSCHLKISKIFTLIGCLWPKYIVIELKNYWGVMFDGTEYWCKIWSKTDLWFQKWDKEFGKFSPGTWKSQNWDFDRILLSKVENVWAQSLHGSYVSWQSRMIQNWKRNWLIVSKLPWKNWRILTHALKILKNLHFNGLFLIKVYNFWTKKIQRSYVWWHRISTQNLKENSLVLSKMTWRIWQILLHWLKNGNSF